MSHIRLLSPIGNDTLEMSTKKVLMSSIVAVHGIGNIREDLTTLEAAASLEIEWSEALAYGLHHAGQGVATPVMRVAYYADLLADLEPQAGERELESLSPEEAELMAHWLRANGVRDEEEQGLLTLWLRQGVSRLALRRGGSSKVLGRVGAAFAAEVYSYLTRPERRRRARAVVTDLIEEVRPAVVLAHSLGSVVTYEALHAVRPPLNVELLVTLGSPLGMPGVYEALEPEPTIRHAARPPRLKRWVNIADRGDVVAVPAMLGGYFDVDWHVEAVIAPVDFHRMAHYLRCGETAIAIAAYISPRLRH